MCKKLDYNHPLFFFGAISFWWPSSGYAIRNDDITLRWNFLMVIAINKFPNELIWWY